MTVNSPEPIKELVKKIMETTIDTENCEEHQYVFIDCMGTYCENCGIAFGEECLHPDCKVHDCKKHMLIFKAFAPSESCPDYKGQLYGDDYEEHLNSCDYCEKYQSQDWKMEFDDVVKVMNDDIAYVHLGHDGVTDGNIEDVKKFLSFKGLKYVEYCCYYTDNNIVNLFKEDKYKHIMFNEIY